MKNYSKYLIYFFALLIIFILPVFAQDDKIEISTEGNISSEVISLTKKTFEYTTAFIKEECGIEFDGYVKIILVENNELYKEAQMRENGVDEEEAERRVRTTSGWSNGTQIIQNIAGLAKNRNKIYNLAHELVHQYQFQICGNEANSIMWIFEGLADAIAIQVVEKSGESTVENYKKDWMKTIKDNGIFPDISLLHDTESWYASLDTYKKDISYRIAAFAILNLLKTKTYKNLFDYFSDLNELNYYDSFKKSFDMIITQYERKFNSLMIEETAP